MAPTNNPEAKVQSILPKWIPSEESFGGLTVWLSYNFAPEWFKDALFEANIPNDHNARRREILFAVCFAESYLVEWVRDTVLNHDFQRLNQYFPPGQVTSGTEKWKRVLKLLHKDGLIPGMPDISLPYWEDFSGLVKMRNGLVHARASRPETNELPEKEKPLPSKGELDKLEAGWAVKVIVELVGQLHKATGTPMPDWIKA